MSHDITNSWAVGGAGTVAIAAFASAVLIVVLRPWLQRHALARPNARSSHSEPTPQGGGIAVIAATILASCTAALFFALDAPTALFAALFGAAVLIACAGALADVRPVGVAPRILLQALAIVIVIYTLPQGLRVIPSLPWWIERVLLVLGGLWFVNLVNFMDGIDWMIVAEVIPLTAGLVALGIVQALPSYGTVLALALGGAVLGFAYFNRPIASVFLGDVGSLSIGLFLGWLLLLLAGSGHLAAAIIMPLYYLCDATTTLLRRLVGGAPIWQAHHAHFYQLAIERGFSVTAVVARVFLVNLGLCGLGFITVVVPGNASDVVAVLAAIALVSGLLFTLARGRKVASSR
jgi:UDP-N-acetylmuramyl pentapeptide phosphotransferase/UDP-N-acetylglucosamine-1-phosphate transferase